MICFVTPAAAIDVGSRVCGFYPVGCIHELEAARGRRLAASRLNVGEFGSVELIHSLIIDVHIGANIVIVKAAFDSDPSSKVVHSIPHPRVVIIEAILLELGSRDWVTFASFGHHKRKDSEGEKEQDEEKQGDEVNPNQRSLTAQGRKDAKNRDEDQGGPDNDDGPLKEAEAICMMSCGEPDTNNKHRDGEKQGEEVDEYEYGVTGSGGVRNHRRLSESLPGRH